MGTIKCRTKAWVRQTPPLREIELEEGEARRLASLGYLEIIGVVEEAATESPTETTPEPETIPEPAITPEPETTQKRGRGRQKSP